MIKQWFWWTKRKRTRSQGEGCHGGRRGGRLNCARDRVRKNAGSHRVFDFLGLFFWNNRIDFESQKRFVPRSNCSERLLLRASFQLPSHSPARANAAAIRSSNHLHLSRRKFKLPTVQSVLPHSALIFKKSASHARSVVRHRVKMRLKVLILAHPTVC